MIVALYTSRKILEALGVEDFGIFNVVGGIISLMSFINGSMSVATQRYLTYELGRGTEGQFNKVFNMAVYIHAIIEGEKELWKWQERKEIQKKSLWHRPSWMPISQKLLKI